MRKAVKNEPQFQALRQKLLCIGGVDFVPPPDEMDNAVETLLAEGERMRLPVVLREMKASHCHSNVAHLWLERYPGMVAIFIGYALSGDDGLWRQHSWGLVNPGGILETTVARSEYFGLQWTGEPADQYAAAVLRAIEGER
jgi:hypothetical protein